MPSLSMFKSRLLEYARPAVRFFRPAPPSHYQPLSRRWAHERGTHVTRHFIDRFMARNRQDITGVVLEIKNRRYTDSLGHGITQADVLDVDASNRDANIITDLAQADCVRSELYDCFMLNETLQFVFDLNAGVGHAHRVLKPGGVLLVSVPCIGAFDKDLFHTDHWRFTKAGCTRLFGNIFGPENVQVEPYGNFGTCMAGLSGVAVEEIPAEILAEHDEHFSVGICIRAQKASVLPQS